SNYSTPTNNSLNSNMIAMNGQYGVYRFESPRNNVATPPQRHANRFRGNPIDLADFLRGVGVNTLPAPKSRFSHTKPHKTGKAAHPQRHPTHPKAGKASHDQRHAARASAPGHTHATT